MYDTLKKSFTLMFIVAKKFFFFVEKYYFDKRDKSKIRYLKHTTLYIVIYNYFL